MKIFFPRLTALLFLLIAGTSFAATAPSQEASAEPKLLFLLSRSVADISAIKLSDDELRWLREKRQVVLGTYAPDHPPFSLTNGRHEFEGITADIFSLATQMLNLNTKILCYPNRQAAEKALQAGDIDVMTDTGSLLATDKNLRHSDSFAQGKSVFMKRIDDKREIGVAQSQLSLAVEEGNASAAEIAHAYPHLNLVFYPSAEAAASAVAFGKNDVLLTDIYTAYYLINLNYKKYLRLTEIGKFEENHFRFTLRRNDTYLLALINKSLSVITNAQRINILKRWTGGSSITMTDAKLNLTEEESRWLKQHPIVRIEAPDNFAPISYFDSSAQFKGITSEILDAIQQRTGLRFDIVRNQSFSAAFDHVANGTSDMVAPALSSVAREDQFLMTRPFVAGQFVLVAKSDNKRFLNLDSLRHKKLAITTGHALHDYIRRTYPDIALVEANSHLAAMDLVATGLADAAVNTNFVAEYYFATVFGNKLRIAGTIDAVNGISPQAGFAVQRSEKELQSIINKALLDIAPDELALLINRWRTNVNPENPTWRDYRYRMYPILAVIAIVLVLSLIGNIALYLKMRRRQVMKQTLQNQLRFMEALINGTPHPIYLRDRKGLLLLCNDGYLSALGLEHKDVIGRKIPTELGCDPEQIANLQKDYAQVMRSGVSMICDRYFFFGGQWHTVYSWIQPFKDASGAIEGIVCGWFDISERRQLVEDLKLAKQMADEANNAKTSFLATMSHEIRTPMNAIIGLLELALKRADQGEMDRPSIEVAYTSANSLLGILGDILDLVRIESGHLTLAPERANLRELAESVLRMYEGMARAKGLALRLQIDLPAYAEVLVDPLRFKQILSNLISNAIKFTDKGSVVATIRTSSIDQEYMQLHISVVDSGIGIADEDRKKLFHLFTQVHDQEHAHRGGTGLGLTICKALCEMMGGSIEIHSVPERGTSVYVYLKLLMLNATGAAVPTQQDISDVRPGSLHVLVIDDNEPNRMLIEQQLLYLGHKVVAAADGAAGLKSWRAQAFDVVITDCQMPEINGYVLTQTIRSEELASGREPCWIVGFTANAQPSEYERCQAAGMNDCLFKPLTLAVLNEHMATVTKITHDETPAYDLAALSAATAHDHAAMVKILSKLIECNRRDLEDMGVKLREGAFAEIAHIAHRIQGGARLISAAPLCACCEGMQCTDADAAEMTIATMATKMEKIKNEIERIENRLLQEYGEHLMP